MTTPDRVVHVAHKGVEGVLVPERMPGWEHLKAGVGRRRRVGIAQQQPAARSLADPQLFSPFLLEACVVEEGNVLPMTPPGGSVNQMLLEC